MKPGCIGISAGLPSPLGANWDGGGTNFALFSAHASKVELCLFDPATGGETARVALPERTDEVWHGYAPEVRPGQLYGYRVYGPYEPERGHRFNPAKLLLDPYARAIECTFGADDRLLGYRAESSRQDLTQDRRDSAAVMPKGRVVAGGGFDWGDDCPPRTPWPDTILYEAHARGLTMCHPQVPESLRGGFLALASPPILEHLTRLGVTAVELLPVQAMADERRLLEAGLCNYWGYNTIGFFAPEPRFMTRNAIADFQTMVRGLHSAGIEVILDVVYNHTAEGDHLGPTLSFRGIDNASYYRLQPDQPRYYVNDTGCGNCLDLTHPRVLQLVMDSLRYWVEVMRIDGFRFDLATALARGPQGFDPEADFLNAVRRDPVLNRVKLIAEPWDAGPDGYRLGGFPPGFAEWNDRCRDGLRRFWRGDAGMLPELASGLLGTAALFDRADRQPWASVNFVTCHDGFTLRDLMSYERKHNQENGEDNRDGTDANHSCNHGVEGPSDDSAIRALRLRQSRNLLATLLLSQGTAMLLAGDELGQTQGGNNNAYCQDNETTWLNWRSADAEGLLEFVRRVIALRKAHPVLRQAAFLHGQERSPQGVKDVTWLAPDGRELTDADWHDAEAKCLGLMLCDVVERVGETFLLLLNAGVDEVAFRLPDVPKGHWVLALDSAAPDSDPATAASFEAGEMCILAGRALMLLRKIEGGAP